MTPEEHKAQHEVLHKFLDELVADFVQHNPGRYLAQTTIMELVQWSHSQTVDPISKEE